MTLGEFIKKNQLREFNIFSYDNKLERWFVVTELELSEISGKPVSIKGFDPTNEDDDGYTWVGGKQRSYNGKPRYSLHII